MLKECGEYRYFDGYGNYRRADRVWRVQLYCTMDCTVGCTVGCTIGSTVGCTVGYAVDVM